MSACKHRHYFPKIGESKFHCLITNELRKKDSDYDRFLPISEKTNSFPVIQTYFRVAVFDPKTKTNFEGETLYRAPISVTASDSRIRKISDSRIYFWVSSEHIMWPSSTDLSLILAEWFSSRDLCHAPLVHELFNPAEFGTKFSSGAKQSSSDGMTKLCNCISSFDGY